MKTNKWLTGSILTALVVAGVVVALRRSSKARTG
jgi:hypothetical protein